jgi:hypothetical protein
MGCMCGKCDCCYIAGAIRARMAGHRALEGLECAAAIRALAQEETT